MPRARVIRSVVLAVLAVVGLVGVPAATATNTSTTVFVQPRQAWTDTGIDIPAGAFVRITARGLLMISLSFGDWDRINPDGSNILGRAPTVPCWSTSPVPRAACHSLVGRVGGGAPFYVGYSAIFTSNDGGRLHLGVNDDHFPDNSDGWTATVTVTANRPPDCSGAAPSVATIQPVKTRFVAIDVLGVTDPDGDPIAIAIDSILQDEPTDHRGNGQLVPDGSGVGTATAQVRAERAGLGNGRVYRVGFTAGDGQGGSCSSEVLVGVPHHRGSRSVLVDDGALYDSTV